MPHLECSERGRQQPKRRAAELGPPSLQHYRGKHRTRSGAKSSGERWPSLIAQLLAFLSLLSTWYVFSIFPPVNISFSSYMHGYVCFFVDQFGGHGGRSRGVRVLLPAAVVGRFPIHKPETHARKGDGRGSRAVETPHTALLLLYILFDMILEANCHLIL